ncbi:uncharacterized protein EAF02_005872 [Botrytis sinoallii]|uniref:uncharacterized protein n=1 Tax=Botrytis sinoallii TaxID=1463999 RepID=UPI0019022D1D|nr:uncharacterized protein EAF02_005872 [Botrytis sinoallii]KAF7882509.1 hypothetical protein EAF02_005872 [Botrytis sinoallii]
MYSYSSWSSLTLLASLLGKMDAYPTQSFLGISSSEPHSLSTHQQQSSPQLSPQSPRTLYTTPSFSSPDLHSSHSGTINVRPPISHFSTSSPISIPFTLTSTCPSLHLDWTCLTTDLLSSLLLLYPSGPTSSPYYTFSHGTPAQDSSSSSSSPSQDTYTISSTILLPTKTKGTEFKSSLYISISPASHAGVAGISKREWRSFIGLLHGINNGLEREMKGMGWGRLAMEGKFPSLKTPYYSERKKGGNRGARKEKLGPSDIIFPSSSSSSSLSEKKPAYPREVIKSWEEEEQEFKTQTERKEEGEISFSYKITWVYYGMTRDANGKEMLRECAQMPEGVEMDFESEESGKKMSAAEGKGEEEEEEEEGKEVKSGVSEAEEEEEQMWKIDL